MKLICILCLSLAATYGSPPSEDEYAATTRYEDAAYDTVMPKATLEASPDCDIRDPKFPKPLKEIIAIGYTGVEQFTKSTNGWTVGRITIRPSQLQSNKCYYSILFRKDYRRDLDIAITVDGRLGEIRKSRMVFPDQK